MPIRGRQSFENIGQKLGRDLIAGTDEQWCLFEELQHNAAEWNRFKKNVLPTLLSKIR